MDFPSDKVLLLSGGVGITPVMSMARWFFDTNAEVDMVFAHSARTPKDIIFRGELEHMCSRISNFELALICEKYDIGESWSGYRGYLNHTMLEMIAPDFMDREVFCCGPTPYMRAVKRLLEETGFDMTRYHEESFGETPAEDVENAVESAEQAQEELEALDNSDLITVEFTQTGKATKIAPGETVHAAAAKLGLHIPKACGMGICGTCKLPKTSGDVEMTHNGGITDEDVAEGFILTCCSVPQSDVTIDF